MLKQKENDLNEALVRNQKIENDLNAALLQNKMSSDLVAELNVDDVESSVDFACADVKEYWKLKLAKADERYASTLKQQVDELKKKQSEESKSKQMSPSSAWRLSDLVISEEDRMFSTNIEYAEASFEVHKTQMINAGITPLEFIPLGPLKKELSYLCAKANNNESYDQRRLDYLILCLEVNPQYMIEKSEARRIWKQDAIKFCKESHDTICSFIPVNIKSANVLSLQTEQGYSLELAKRIMSRKCLWLVRIEIDEIAKMHEADLLYRYNTGGQQLDVVELAAVLASMPNYFHNDPMKKNKILF